MIVDNVVTTEYVCYLLPIFWIFLWFQINQVPNLETLHFPYPCIKGYL